MHDVTNTHVCFFAIRIISMNLNKVSLREILNVLLFGKRFIIIHNSSEGNYLLFCNVGYNYSLILIRKVVCEFQIPNQLKRGHIYCNGNICTRDINMEGVSFEICCCDTAGKRIASSRAHSGPLFLGQFFRI